MQRTVVQNDTDRTRHPDGDDWVSATVRGHVHGFALPTTWGRGGTRQLSPRNSLMNAGMTIFLGWFVGGRASAILRVSMAVHVPGLADTDLTSILSPWDRSIPTSDARGMPFGLARDVGERALRVP